MIYRGRIKLFLYLYEHINYGLELKGDTSVMKLLYFEVYKNNNRVRRSTVRVRRSSEDLA
jgi:hypothetical protein